MINIEDRATPCILGRIDARCRITKNVLVPFLKNMFSKFDEMLRLRNIDSRIQAVANQSEQKHYR